MRINKFLSTAGVASRRAADQLIKAGRVTKNGQTATLGDQVDPAADSVKVDGKRVLLTQTFEYLMLNKPFGVLSTVTDDRDRKTVIDLIYSKQRLYPVGRLDYNSTGLILLTNDGDFALRLTHPRYHLPKVYLVEINKPIIPAHLSQLKLGIVLDDGPTEPAEIAYTDISKRKFKIILHQGKNRQIRRMFEHYDYRVLHLHRTNIGPLFLGSLQPGQSRSLTSHEVSVLKRN